MCRLLLLLVLASYLGSSPAAGQPRWSGTPIEGGETTSMLRAADGTIWAIAGGAAFASADLGITWERRSTGMKWRTRFLNQAQDGTLFATSATLGTARIYRSTDNGASWSETAGPNPVGVTAFAVPPADSAVWMFTSGDDLWRTADAGDSWDQVATAPDLPVGPACQPASASICLLGSRASNGIFKTSDGGATWVASSTGLPTGLNFDQFEFDPVTPSVVYAVARNDDGLFKSTDSGNSWTTAAAGLPANLRDIDDLAITRETPAQLVILLETQDGIHRLYESLDSGASWSSVYAFSAAEPRTVERVAPSAAPNAAPKSESGAGAAVLVVAGERGIERSSDSGTSFAPSNSGFEATQLARLVARTTSPSWIYAHSTAQGPYVSTDGGATWPEKTTGLPKPGALYWALDVTPDDSQLVVLANETDFYRTINGGDSWTSQAADLTPFGDCGFVPITLTFSIDSDDLWIGHQGCSANMGAISSPEILVSGDQGATWTPLFDLPPSTTTTFSSPFGRLLVHPSNPNLALVSSLLGPTSETVVRRTLDRGVTWSEAFSDPGTAGYLAMAPSDPSRIYLALEGIETAGGVTTVLRSDDTGATWTNLMTTGISCVTSIAVDFDDPNRVWVGCETVHQSLDGGATWTDLGTLGLADPVSFGWLEAYRIGRAKVLMATTNVGIYSYPVNGIFADAFESGNTTAWTSTSP